MRPKRQRSWQPAFVLAILLLVVAEVSKRSLAPLQSRTSEELGGRGGQIDLLTGTRALQRWKDGVLLAESLLDDYQAEAPAGGLRMPVYRDDAEQDAQRLFEETGGAVMRQWVRDNTLVVAFSNAAYLEEGLVPNLVCSFQRLNVSNWVLVVTDAAAQAEAKSLQFGDHVYWNPSYWKGTSASDLRTTYNSTDEYLHFIQLRTKFARLLIEHLIASNKNVPHEQQVTRLVFTDGDTVWVHHPLHVIQQLLGTTPEAAASEPFDKCDGYVVNDIYNGAAATEKKMRVEPVGGFLVWNLGPRNEQKIRRLYQVWTDLMRCLGSREQPALHGALALLKAVAARPWTELEQSSDTLSLCVLPEYHFPTSAHLNMRATNKGPMSNYLQDYHLKDLSSVGRSIVVAHSNLKYKRNKQAWLSQFRLFMWDGRRRQCTFEVKGAINAGASGPLTLLSSEQRHIELPQPMVRSVGWVREGAEYKGAWINDMQHFLDYHRSPGANWTRCKAALR
ncbi:hypothetical protein DIPPA_14170 [Diplonema papillatum]|nr:hypothetical protein DIPPA_14170 [Diplonema papillatum]KAJ9450486.1 hypothetical protein DIPPA_14170 [Diplonema papillatum]